MLARVRNGPLSPGYRQITKAIFRVGHASPVNVLALDTPALLKRPSRRALVADSHVLNNAAIKRQVCQGLELKWQRI